MGGLKGEGHCSDLFPLYTCASLGQAGKRPGCLQLGLVIPPIRILFGPWHGVCQVLDWADLDGDREIAS